MDESGLAHVAWRRSNSSRESHVELIQLLVGQFDLFRAWSAVAANLWLKSSELLYDCRDSVFSAWFNDLAAFEFVWIDVAYHMSQSFQVLATRSCLIVFFKKRKGHKSSDYIRRCLYLVL